MYTYNRPHYTYRIERHSAIVEFLDDRIDMTNGPSIKDKLTGLIDRHNLAHIILCLGRVQFLDSKGLAAIIGVWKFAATKKDGTVVSIADCAPPIEHFLRMCKIEHIFRIYRNEAEALAAYADLLPPQIATRHT